ncbi:JAB domain-containing protein [Marinoscillum sp.]|uniref:JAB domain-containing protein n=1 Tax=Marinoscillum sp. TaxID=2024838 RepID=UPI003BA868CC
MSQEQIIQPFKKSIQEIQIVKEPDAHFEQIKIHSSRDVAELLCSIWPVALNYREAFISLNLDRGNKPLSYALISIGGISSTVVDVKVIMQHALMSNASSIIIAHNHPSGNLKASQADLNVTKKVKAACEVMEISLLDHIIVTEERGKYFSFSDECMI